MAVAARIRHVILDRDGVLNAEQAGGGWVSDWSQWCWLPGATEALRMLSAAGVRISLITNQSGIGRGSIARANVDAVHAAMLAEAAREGATIQEVLVCPHAPTEGCDCRKPAPGLFVQAMAASGVPARETIAVGDDLRDLQAAWSAGVSAVLVRTGKGRRTEACMSGWKAPVYDDLRDFAAAVIADTVPRESSSLLTAHRIFREHLNVAREASTSMPAVLEEVAAILEECVASGHKVLACGNGGSAAAAQHFVAELIGRFSRDRRAVPALALTADQMVLTALANDYGYERVFARQVEALARPGDVLMAFSTSGNSPNVIAAARAAKRAGCKVVGFSGGAGGSLAASADIVLRAPSADVARIQEVHDICIHALAECVEDALDRTMQP
jgi:D-sedoheptulose 7-phosphate isomerase